MFYCIFFLSTDHNYQVSDLYVGIRLVLPQAHAK